ncbi:MAG: V-type ATP synthase subunit I [Candidatus Lambdaproteobacteria bacterium]|nr:V-type ATP synthase subunit I [Candidatus Lambdaproteobacteria bacterium]
MSIVPLHKVTLCGLVREKRAILEGLQALGCLHLVSLRPPSEEPEAAALAPGKDALEVLRYLLDCPHRLRQVREDADFDVNDVVARTLDNRQRTQRASDRRDFTARRIRDVEPWGDFTLPPEDALDGYKLWFYIVPRPVRSEQPVWQVVHEDNRNAYVVVVAREEPSPASMPVPRTHTGALSLSQLQANLDQAEFALEELAAERSLLTRWILLLSHNLAVAENRAALARAMEQTLEHEALCVVQGWIARNNLPRLDAFAAAQRLAVLVEEVSGDDEPPTLLDNPESVAGGEEIVQFFQMPGYRIWDPSAVVFFSFALFFAMILADAGYAALLALLLGAFWRRLGRTVRGRRLRSLGSLITGLSLIYGVAAGSYFGLAPAPESLPGALHVVHMDDYPAMMRLAVSVGVLHLMLAHAITAWRLRGSPRIGAPLGWIATMAGGMALWLGGGGVGPDGLLSAMGPWLIGLGLGAVLLGSSDRPLRGGVNLARRLLDGLLAVTDVSKVFGDVLSYLRLFALGLASASLAATFNELATTTLHAVPGVGVLLYLLILGLGHGLNFVLCIVSGLVHGLRLNLIEFYNWSVSEQGYPFQAFRKKEVEVWSR